MLQQTGEAGPGASPGYAEDVIYSGILSEKTEFAGFVSDYNVMHRWRKLDTSSEMLITGADNKTFPIPAFSSLAGHPVLRDRHTEGEKHPLCALGELIAGV